MSTGADPPAMLNMLVELIERGDLATALRHAEELLQKHPQNSEIWRLLAICLFQQGRISEAEKALRHALELDPHSVEIQCNFASVYMVQNRVEEAESALRKAIELNPEHAAALNNLGTLLDSRGNYQGAIACFARAAELQPRYASAWLNQAATLLAVQEYGRAEMCAQRALAIAPQWADAHFVLANVRSQHGKKSQAIESYRQAVQFAPDNPHIAYALALLLEESGDWPACAAVCEKAGARTTSFLPLLSQWVYVKRRLCDWSNLKELSQRLIAAVEGEQSGITPFSFLTEDATPAQQLSCARSYAKIKQAEATPLAQRLQFGERQRRAGPLRVGFFSAGFGEHPTALLIAQLIERLRSAPLITIGFATTLDDQGVLRRRLQTAFREFHDLHGLGCEATARAIHERDVDILIDLDGYCGGSMPELFALKPAPLQVNWLAFPGTLGAPWYDYMIADAFVIPAEMRKHYSEAMAWLPRCFQPSDTSRSPSVTPSRADCGLPENAVVFVSFNNTYKFTPDSFAKWMAILKATANSVLWLLDGPAGTPIERNLRSAAHNAGVAPQRLVFSRKTAHADYLARYCLADLFLDTNPYNAHTTASDALWMGCPVLTQPGETFASRVAGSLNHHLGLAEMNASSNQDYIDKAVDLANNPHLLTELRQRLDLAKRQSTLFDMDSYALDFAELLKKMHQRRSDGEPAGDL